MVIVVEIIIIIKFINLITKILVLNLIIKKQIYKILKDYIIKL